MSDLTERLRALSRSEHDDLSVAGEAADEIERWRAFRNEMQEQQRQLEKLTERFLELDAFDRVSECATKAEGIKYVLGRMPKLQGLNTD